MTTTLSDLQTQLARQLHDTSNTTWSVAELTDLINQGIDALADFYPKEIVQTVGTVSATAIHRFVRIRPTRSFDSTAMCSACSSCLMPACSPPWVSV